MLAPRIGETLQPAWARTTSVVAMKLQPALARTTALSRGALTLTAFALRPAAFVALACGVWRVGIDLGWTQDFFVSEGLFSHWQVWLALALGMITAAGFLSRTAGAIDDSEGD
jgi:hypothetical protein